MNKPWDVRKRMISLMRDEALTDSEFESRFFEILVHDDSEGIWISGDTDDQRALDLLGIGWDDVKEIFEKELTEEIRYHAACNRQEAREATD